MENDNELSGSLLEKVEEYGKTSLELLRLKMVDKTSGTLSSFAPQIILSLFVGVFFILFNVGVSIWMGELLGKYYYGFFAVSGFYLVLSVIIYFNRRWIKEKASDAIIKNMMS